MLPSEPINSIPSESIFTVCIACVSVAINSCATPSMASSLNAAALGKLYIALSTDVSPPLLSLPSSADTRPVIWAMLRISPLDSMLPATIRFLSSTVSGESSGILSPFPPSTTLRGEETGMFALLPPKIAEANPLAPCPAVWSVVLYE